MCMTASDSCRPVFLAALILLVFSLPLFPETKPLMVSQAADSLGAEIFVDPVSGAVSFLKNNRIVNFKPGSPVVLFDSKPVYMDSALDTEPPFVPEEIFSKMQEYFSSYSMRYSYRVGAILIDPGHGGKDPGAIGSYTVDGKTVSVREKDVVLSVSLDLYNRLKTRYPDKKILLTRSGDTYPSLEDRVNMANSVELAEHEAILYISVHANAAFNKKSSGFEVWYLTPDYRRTVIDESSVDSAEILPILNSMMEEEFTTESILIAKFILDGMEEQIGDKSENRGLKAESWFVVRNARMPSVLIELGFVTNDTEVRLLSDKGYLQKCAAGIYNGLVNFISYFENSGGPGPSND